jgi:hypothetical protein
MLLVGAAKGGSISCYPTNLRSQNSMRIISMIFMMAFLSSVSFAQTKVDIDKANKMVTDKKYLEALQILAPCLNSKTVKEISNLEECLYYGESVAQKAIVNLNQEYNNYKAKTTPSSNGRDEDFKTWLPVGYTRVGLDLTVDQWAEIVYQNEYIRSLQKMFPQSKYKAEIDYKIIDLNANVDEWKQWESSLLIYLKKYPEGPYSVRAKYDLARMYYDLWGLVNPDTKEFLVVSFRSGDPAKDREDSERYRQEAIRLFTEILKVSDKSILTKGDQESIQKILPSLKKGEHAPGVGCFITRGYD